MTILEKWRSVETNDKIMNKELAKKDKFLVDSFIDGIVVNAGAIVGLMGAGTNKINVHTVAAAAKAYAIFLKNSSKDPSVLIARDNRNNSSEFYKVVSNVMQANGVEVISFKEQHQPTSLVSYVLRKMKLSGAIIVSAASKTKEYNGLKFLNDFGVDVSDSNSEKISQIMGDIDPLSVERSSKTTDSEKIIVDESLIKKYIDEILTVRLTDETDVNIVYSAQHGNGAIMMPNILNKMGIKHFEVEKQQGFDSEFKGTKTPDPEDGKSFYYAELVARKEKADAMIATNSDGSRFGAAVKHQRRFKYLNSNQLAAVYADFMFSQLKLSGRLSKDSFIVKTNLSGNLTSRIAEKYGVKVYETHTGFNNIANLIEEKKDSEEFLFAFDESNGFLINDQISKGEDSFQTAVAVVDMISFYKKENVNLYEKHKELCSEYGIYRTVTSTKKLDKKMINNLFKNIKKVKSVGDEKVVDVQDFRRGFGDLEAKQLVKINLKNGSWFAITSEGMNEEVKIYVQTVGSKTQELIDIVTFEKKIERLIEDNTEEFLNKKFSWKGLLKYSVFISLIIGTMAIVFTNIYTDGSTRGDVAQTYTVASGIMNATSRWVWLTMWLWVVFTQFLSAWMKKRMFQRQGEFVRSRHLVVASIMGGVVAFVTPFAVGGDAIGYWYLRRKGVKRGPLIATLTSSTLLGEGKFTLQVIFLAAIGWGVYKQVFAAGDIESSAAIIWFFVGLGWTVFSTFMIFLLTLNKRFQEFIVRTSLKLLEWFRFTHIYDPGKVSSGFQFEFMELREGMKRIWSTWWFPFELLFYDMIPLFFNPGALAMSCIGAVNANAAVGTYWSQIVAHDIVGAANSMSITPGGSGTGEWLNISINHVLYDNSSFANAQGVTGKAVASGIDLFWKLFSTWPFYVFSGILIFTTILLENKRFLMGKHNKNNRLNGLDKTVKSNMKVYIFGLWIVVIATYLILYFTVLF